MLSGSLFMRAMNPSIMMNGKLFFPNAGDAFK
jgi:hypothetical protein